MSRGLAVRSTWRRDRRWSTAVSFPQCAKRAVSLHRFCSQIPTDLPGLPFDEFDPGEPLRPAPRIGRRMLVDPRRGENLKNRR